MERIHQRHDLGAYAHGAFGVDYEGRIDFAALREQRLARATARLKESELDALLLWKDENVRFLTGLRPQIIQGKSALLNGCLLKADGLPGPASAPAARWTACET